MLFPRQERLLPKLSQKSHVNRYLEQFYWKIHVNICTFQSNKSLKKKFVSYFDECGTDSSSLFSVPSCQLNETFLQIIGNYFETAYYMLMCDNDVEKGLWKCKSLLP
jgi:nicotinic acid phosphoribosyltransferase